MPKFYFLIIPFVISTIVSAQNKDADRSISNILPLNGDTLIATKWNQGILLTYDAGKTWQELHPNMLLKLITIDNKGTIWGLNSWRGIHERSYSRIYKSEDKGRTWSKTEFDLQKFFPMEIVSKPGTTLQITTIDKKIYTLNGENILTDWIYDSTVLERRNKNRDDHIKVLRGDQRKVLLHTNSNLDSIYVSKNLFILI